MSCMIDQYCLYIFTLLLYIYYKYKYSNYIKIFIYSTKYYIQ